MHILINLTLEKILSWISSICTNEPQHKRELRGVGNILTFSSVKKDDKHHSIKNSLLPIIKTLILHLAVEKKMKLNSPYTSFSLMAHIRYQNI